MIDSRAARHFDFLLVLFAACLVAYGALLIYSAQLSEHPGGVNLAHPLTKQLMFAIFGLCVMFAVAWLDYRVFGQMAVGLYALAVLMLVDCNFIYDFSFVLCGW